MADSPLKLLFAGPVGAGKTTAIRALSDGPPVSTEAPLSVGATAAKATTTVAFDYSTVRVDDDISVHLYGIPGQDHFDFMRPIIANGALGVIVLLDATSSTLKEDCVYWLSAMTAIDPGLKFVVGISKSDLNARFSLGDVREGIRSCGLMAPAMCVDPRDERQCTQLVRALLLTL